MAIKTTFQFRGMTIPEAYLRITHVAGSKENGWTADIGVYANEEVRASGEIPITTFQTHVPGLNSPRALLEDGSLAPIPKFNVNPYKAVYDKLKKENEGSVDL